MAKSVLSKVVNLLFYSGDPHYRFPDGVTISKEHSWVSRAHYREGWEAEDDGISNPYPRGSIMARSWDCGAEERRRFESAIW